jgi:aminoglycoside phosphotransferase (APT) family kinase protein
VAGSAAEPVLSAAEADVAAGVLASAWGERTEIRTAELIWNRRHIVRLHLGDGHSVVLKRRGDQRPQGGQDRSFGAELAVLEYLNAMPVPVAPRLLGADPDAGILLIEDLGPGTSLADSLLAEDRARAEADLVAYARALGALHAWSIGRPGNLAGLWARYAHGAPPGPAWLGAAERHRDVFLEVVARLDVPADGVTGEISQMTAMLAGTGYAGLVHGDACPDNVHLAGGVCRIFDFETSGWGCVALDATYLQAPFPSCWCFASLPAAVAAPAVTVYRNCLQDAGIELGRDWDAVTAAAMAAFLIARGPMISAALDEDRPWGTTTMRPRLLTWLRTFTGTASRAGVLPRLADLAATLHDQLSRRWPGLVIPEYPALAQPGAAALPLPDWWPPKD